ncbi:MAG: ATP-binding protein [Pseudomonadota bacterium]
MLSAISKALAGHKSQHEGEYLSVTGGVRTPVRALFAPIISDNGKIAGAIGIFEDISEQLSTEKEKLKLMARLQQSQKMEAIGTLSGGIAHDFNNILSPIIGYVEMLQDDLLQNSPEQKKIIEILHAALRAKDLVKQILAFSRQSDQELKPVRIQFIIKEALKLLKSSIPTTINFQIDIDPDCGMVVADPSQIHQIIMNLATNAYHAVQESAGQIKISLKQTEIDSTPLGFLELLPGKYALLKVTDTGKGIKKEIMDKIFEPYFTTKETGKGTGLGLSVVQGIVKNCHGDIHVYSEPGKGTEFHVYLPIIKIATEIDNADPFEPIQRGSERILLVDDEEMIVKMEKQVLERLGYHVTTRTGSTEAFEAFKANPSKFDLIISDMTMPGMTGVQLCNEIKKIRPGIPVIICSGFSDQINEETSKKLGIQGYVMKPVIIREIAKIIREVLNIKIL